MQYILQYTMFASDNPQPVTHFNLNNLNIDILGTNDNTHYLY